ncbi:putative immunity protein [Ruoffia sp. FAM 24228]|uniref:putative immunity protein n=1 Tax=unclassified Ruoffia TaxID=2862149 RepID=UPI00388995C6
MNDISKFSVRVFAQVVATGHMQGDAIVSSDYAIKVVNILYYHDEQAAINEIILINLFPGKISRRVFIYFQTIHSHVWRLIAVNDILLTERGVS